MEIFFSFGFGLLVKVYGYIKSNAIRPFSRFSHKSQAFFAFVSHTLVTTENREHNEDKAHSTYVGTYVHNNRDWMRNLKDTIVLQVQMRDAGNSFSIRSIITYYLLSYFVVFSIQRILGYHITKSAFLLL